jgi:hypothetical protein
VAYAWGVNGVSSVLASVLGVALAINFGFAMTSLIAAACYAAALLHAAVGRWPSPDGPVDTLTRVELFRADQPVAPPT